MHWRIGIGLLILALQAGAIIRGRFVPDRYFCWAPFDQQTKYEITVTTGDTKLSRAQILQRYRRPAKGVDNRSAHNLFDIITRAEQKLADRSQVLVQYTVNGRERQEWRYPQ